jgi:hypothetical protein
MSDLLNEVRKSPEFQAVMDEALKHRPVVPAFVICDTKDAQEMVIENIKFQTARQNGFDFLYQFLVGRKPKGDL